MFAVLVTRGGEILLSLSDLVPLCCPASLGIVGYCVYVSLAIVRKFACACACTITLWGLIGSSCLCKGYLEVLRLCLVCVMYCVLVYAFVFVFT